MERTERGDVQTLDSNQASVKSKERVEGARRKKRWLKVICMH